MGGVTSPVDLEDRFSLGVSSFNRTSDTEPIFEA